MSAWEKLLLQWSKIRMAHEAVMLADAQDLLAQQRRQTASHFDAMTGARPADDDMGGVHIGDIINQQQPAPPTTRRLAWLPTALAAASLVTTGGIGALVLSRLATATVAPPAVVQPVPQQPAAAPVSKEFRIKFWIENGTAKVEQLP